MKIGELASRAGVSPRLVRYYEQQGLLEPDRESNGYRSYGEEHVVRVQRIAHPEPVVDRLVVVALERREVRVQDVGNDALREGEVRHAVDGCERTGHQPRLSTEDHRRDAQQGDVDARRRDRLGQAVEPAHDRRHAALPEQLWPSSERGLEQRLSRTFE